MFSLLRTSPVLLGTIALLPGALCWVQGRNLLRLADDPLLPERLAVSRRRNGLAFVIALATLVALDPAALPWTAPLLIVVVLAAGYPSRRTLYGETWGIAACIWFNLRLYFALFGFWMVLAATPPLAHAAGTHDWFAGCVLGIVLLAWNHWYADVLRQCLGAQALPDGPLLASCRALSARCAVPVPRFECIDLQGGVIANALALPSLRQSSVLFTDTLLERLDHDEVAAICAHELAHLEYYNRQRLRRMNAATVALVVTAAGWTTVTRAAGFDSGWTALPWLAVLVTALVMRAQGKQRQETVCDARAVELTSDGDALVRALTKLYSIARIPRRIELQRERSDTHPSLARRIRDIRKAAGQAGTNLQNEATFTSPDGGAAVTFDAAGVRWTHDAAVQHSVEYAQLTELRIDAGAQGAARLVLSGPKVPRRALPLVPGDIPRAQALLDSVDGRLGEAGPPARVPLRLGRTAAACATLLALAAGHVAVAVVALLSVVRPVTPLLLAASLSAAAAATLALGDGGLDALGLRVFPAALAGIVFLVLAHAKRHEEGTAAVRGPVAALAGLAVLSLGSVALSGVDAVQFNLAAHSSPAGVVFLTGLGGALASSRLPRMRTAGLLAVLVAAGVGFAASPLFLDTFGRDPLLVEGPRLVRLPIEAVMLEEFDVPGITSRLQLSPAGTYIAVREEPHSEENRTATYHVGRAGAHLRAVHADDAVFTDERHLLLAVSDRRGTTVREVTIDPSHELSWEQHVSDVSAGRLSFTRSTGHWRITGWSDDRTLVRAEGVVGTAEVERTEWPDPSGDEGWLEAFTTSGNTALVVESRYDPGPLDRFVPLRWKWVLFAARPAGLQSQYAVIGPRGRTELGNSRFGADCDSGLLRDDTLLCTIYDGTRTRLVSIDATGRIGALGWFYGTFVGDDNPTPGWLTGWAGSTPVAIRLGSRDMIALEDGTVTRITLAGDRLAALTYDGTSTKVRTYAVHPPGVRARNARLRTPDAFPDFVRAR